MVFDIVTPDFNPGDKWNIRISVPKLKFVKELSQFSDGIAKISLGYSGLHLK